jgi:mycofactocin system glycosyltransferase
MVLNQLCETPLVSQHLPLAPSPTEAPLRIGTRVVLDSHARFLDRNLLSGGSPWRLLRLPGGSHAVAARWQQGGEVQAGEERFARTLVQQGLLHPLHEASTDIDDVDVVVPVLDDVDALCSLLARLRGLHVTVVDDGSADRGAMERSTTEFGATYVRIETNRGPAAARNAGALLSTRPLLWFIDVDVEFADARSVLYQLGEQFADPMVAAVAPRITGTTGSSMFERFEHRFSPLDLGERGGIVVPGGSVSYVPSACLLIRRDSFGEGFDETMRVGEDVDLVWRLHDHGWLIRYVPSVIVQHRARSTVREWWKQRVGYGASSGELARRHGKRMAPLRADSWTLFAWGTVLAGKPAIGGRVARVAHERLRARFSDTTDESQVVAAELVGRGMVGAGGPLARALVRNFGVVVLASALHPKLRRRALSLFVIGTAWRWRTKRVHVADIPFAVADDLAYGLGTIKGAWEAKTVGALWPHVTKSTLGLRDVLGLAAKKK